MNKKIKISCALGIVVFLVSLMLMLFFKTGANSTSNQANKQAHQIKVLQLNTIGKNADDTTIEHVEIDKKNTDMFAIKRIAYQVEKAEYTQSDLKRVASCLNTKIEKINKHDDIQTFDLNNKGFLMYYNNSGSITYISEANDKKDKLSRHKFNKQKCIKVAEEFVKNSNIIDFDDLVLSDVQIGYSVETSSGEFPLTYQVTFMQKSPQGVDGFAGIGPGIRIDVDSEYEISSFTSINKKISELEDKYDTLTLKEAEEKIENNEELQLISTANDIKDNKFTDVTIEDVEVRLYCDSVNLKQQYMVPYYVLTGEDDSGAEVSLTMPAISDNEIEVRDVD